MDDFVHCLYGEWTERDVSRCGRNGAKTGAGSYCDLTGPARGDGPAGGMSGFAVAKTAGPYFHPYQ